MAVFVSSEILAAALIVTSTILFFVRVNQVLVRLWALPSQSLTGRFGVPAMAMVFRGDCCVLSKSLICDVQGHPPLRMVSVHGGGLRACPGDRISSERRAFGGCLGTRRR